jgi:glutamyl-tRNA synthetase
MTVEALKEYILMQGASKNVLLLEWDKIWAVNRRLIDPVAPRYTALAADSKVLLTLAGAPATPTTSDVPRHKKNSDVGTKSVTFSARVWLEHDDAAEIADNEEVLVQPAKAGAAAEGRALTEDVRGGDGQVTLMDWGNAIVRTVSRDASGRVTALAGELHLEGDFKKTKKKLTWLSAYDDDEREGQRDAAHRVVTGSCGRGCTGMRRWCRSCCGTMGT